MTQEKRVVVFAGAGASRAVSKDYPTTPEFLELVPPDIQSDPLFGFAIHHLKRDDPKRTIDIELVLGFLDTAARQLQEMSSPDTPLGYLLEGNRASSLYSPQLDFQDTRKFGVALTKRIRDLRDQINALVYSVYRTVPAASSLDSNWLRVLRGLGAAERRCELFTTNYDPVIEEAIRLSEARVDSGRRDGVYPRLDIDKWRGARDENTGWLMNASGHGLLTKLHGDVSWSREGADIYMGTPLFNGNHARHVILYPGYKDEPTEEPFASFHRHFSLVVGGADAMAFVGFAFRDPAIDRVLERRLSNECRVVVVNPNLRKEQLPASLRHRAKIVPKPFDGEGAEALVAALLAA